LRTLFSRKLAVSIVAVPVEQSMCNTTHVATPKG